MPVTYLQGCVMSPIDFLKFVDKHCRTYLDASQVEELHTYLNQQEGDTSTEELEEFATELNLPDDLSYTSYVSWESDILNVTKNCKCNKLYKDQDLYILGRAGDTIPRADNIFNLPFDLFVFEHG